MHWCAVDELNHGQKGSLIQRGCHPLSSLRRSPPVLQVVNGGSDRTGCAVPGALAPGLGRCSTDRPAPRSPGLPRDRRCPGSHAGHTPTSTRRTLSSSSARWPRACCSIVSAASLVNGSNWRSLGPAGQLPALVVNLLADCAHMPADAPGNGRAGVAYRGGRLQANFRQGDYGARGHGVSSPECRRQASASERRPGLRNRSWAGRRL